MMNALRLHHVGIVVEEFADVQRVLGDCLGLDMLEPELEPELGIEIMWVAVGSVGLEFIRPTGPDTKAAAVLRDGKGGVHHVAFAVEDIELALAHVGEAGIAVLDPVPRAGVHGSRIAFIDPASAGGTLVELVQPGQWDPGART
jgi:methylmalonyl-CoA/ethylmalonyl-CoA epimerase